MRSCQWTQHQAFYGHLAFEANWKGERSQYVSVSWADQKRKKTNKRCFDVSSLFLHDNNERFINCAMKSGQLTTGDDQLSGWIEKKHQSTSQSQTCNKKGVLVTLWWSAAGLIYYIFLNPREIIISGNFTQQNECPNAFHITNSSKVELIGLQNFTSSAIFTWPLPSDCHFLKHLNNILQGKYFHNWQDADNAFQVFTESWSINFYATEINKHFLLAKMCWL